MKYRCGLTLICYLFTVMMPIQATHAGYAGNTRIDVFADRFVTALKIKGFDVYTFDLSQLTALKANPPRFEADSVAAAERKMERWMASPGYQQHIQRLKESTEPYELMGVYGVAKVPAIVFDYGAYAVYGTTDIAKAVRVYQRYRSGLK